MRVHLSLYVMSDIFSLKDMFKFFVESKGENEPCWLGTQRILKE